jgi:hypothetical protein
MSDVHYSAFLVLGVIVGGVSLFVSSMRIFIIFGIAFIIWGLIKMLISFSSRKKKADLTHNVHHQNHASHSSHVGQGHTGIASNAHRPSHNSPSSLSHTGHVNQNHSFPSHQQMNSSQHPNNASNVVRGPSPLNNTSQPVSHKSNDYKRCPNCSRVSHTTYRFCPYCGYGV